MLTQRAVYLDHNATHPLLPAVRDALSAALARGEDVLFNPSSVHRHGQKAKAMVADLRARLGAVAGRTDGDEWVFTSGATEAINTVLRGFCANRREDRRRAVLITSAAEHSAVLETLPHAGAFATEIIGVGSDGRLNFAQLSAALECHLSDPQVDVLLSLNLLNNETGVLLDMGELRTCLAAVRAKFESADNVSGALKFAVQSEACRLWVHLDAAQALGKLEPRLLRLAWFEADYVSVSAHKMGGAAGIGALWVRPQVPFSPFMTGGVQEKKRRAGTFNSLAAFTWIQALGDWAQHGDAYRAHLQKLRDHVHAQLSQMPGYHAHGLQDGKLPAAVNTLNFHIDGCDEESLVMALDVEGFSVSSGSACNSGSLKPSHVLQAMGFDDAVALSSVRLSVGISTTQSDVDDFLQSLRQIVGRINDGKAYWASVLPQMKGHGNVTRT